MPYVRFVLICLIWGGSFLLMKKGALSFGPVSIAALRVSTGAFVLALLWLLYRPGKGGLERSHLGPLAAVSLIGYAWPYAVQPYLVARHGSAFIGMTISLVPLLTILVSPWLLGVYPNRRQIIGVVGGLGFILLMFQDGLNRQVPWQHLALAATVPLSYAVTNTYVRRRFVGVSSLAVSIVALLVAMSVLVPLAGGTEAVRSPETLWMATAAVATLGGLGTGISTFWFNKLVQEQGPLFAGMTTYVVPLGALVWGWLDQEPVTTLQLIALSGVLAMVALVQYRAATPR